MIKKLFFLLILIFNLGNLCSQDIVNEGILRVNGTTTNVHFGYDYTNKATGVHENRGSLRIIRNFTNNGSMTNTDPVNGRTIIMGSGTQEINGSSKLLIFKNLEVSKVFSAVTVETETELRVINSVTISQGTLRLLGSSQLVQTHTGVSQVTTGTFSRLYKDQEGTTTNVYQSGYWSSPVSGVNKTTFTISDVLKDGTTPTSATSFPQNINFPASTTVHDGAKTSPITISRRWLAKLINDVDFTRFIDPANHQFNIGEGWNMKSTGGGTQNFTFRGVPNDGIYTSFIDDGKLSLIGNPYPSALDADQFIADNAAAIAGTLYFYESGNDVDHIRRTYTGGYATYNGTTGVAFNGGATPQRYIPVAQAFFVFRDVDNGGGTGTIGSGANITFQNSQRAFQTRNGNSNFFSKSSQGKRNNDSQPKNNDKSLLKLDFEFDVDSNRKFQRQLAVGFIGLTDDYENGFDAEMFGMEQSDIALLINNRNTPFVISGREYYDENIEIPLLINLDIDRQVSFKINTLENINANVYLNDKIENKTYLLSNNLTSLNIDKGSYNDRFFISFKNFALSVDEELSGEFISVYYNARENSIFIKTENEILDVNIYNILGQEIKFSKNKDSSKILLDDSKANQILILRVKTDKNIINKKIKI